MQECQQATSCSCAWGIRCNVTEFVLRLVCVLLLPAEDFIPEEMIIVDTDDGAEVFAYGELQVGVAKTYTVLRAAVTSR